MDISEKNQVDALFKNVVDAMQDAEEMGGPEGEAYQLLMQRIAEEAQRRAKTHWINEMATDEVPHEGAPTLLTHLVERQTKALASITAGDLGVALLHTRMLGLYHSRLAELPVMSLTGDDIERIKDSLIYHFDMTENHVEDDANKALASRL